MAWLHVILEKDLVVNCQKIRNKKGSGCKCVYKDTDVSRKKPLLYNAHKTIKNVFGMQPQGKTKKPLGAKFFAKTFSVMKHHPTNANLKKSKI